MERVIVNNLYAAARSSCLTAGPLQHSSTPSSEVERSTEVHRNGELHSDLRNPQDLDGEATQQHLDKNSSNGHLVLMFLDALF
ncbi:hypothetical protein CPB85DRAFT_781627 [Mucidula mucida]|nr:hypothetical protein CPB85DRAFT_781627 [Mucidula mucida]